MSMRIERSSLDQVKKRFELNKRKLEEKKKDYDLEQRVKELREEVSNIIASIIREKITFFNHWKKKNIDQRCKVNKYNLNGL